MNAPLTRAVQTPFDSVENAQAYIQLLIETLVEAKKEIAADAAAARSARSERRLQALRPVEYKLHRLQHHLTISGRMLNDLRRLRRLLLDEAADQNYRRLTVSSKTPDCLYLLTARRHHGVAPQQSSLFEILDFTLVLYGRSASREGSQIPATTGGGVFLSGIEPILSGF
jgi:hypothetical protein